MARSVGGYGRPSGTPRPGLTPISSPIERAATAATWRDAATVGRVPVVGGSMRPLIPPGSALRVQGGCDPRFGDVVVANTPAGLVVHRVIARSADSVRLRGDDTRTTDAPLARTDLLGRVTAIEGFAGRRLDAGAARWCGVAVAAYARSQMAFGDRPARPRPSALMSVFLSGEQRALPSLLAADRLILCLARLEISEAARSEARALADGDLDWDRVVRHSALAQLGPLVYRGLQAMDLRVPAAAHAALRRQALGASVRSQEIRGLLASVLTPLREAGIPVLAHKGVALAATVYPDPSLRISGDIDLSVPDRDRVRAELLVADLRAALVAANPYRTDPRGHHIELDGTSHHDVDPARSGGGRWRSGHLDWEGIWARAIPIDGHAGALLVPAPTDLLVTLVANSVRRGFTPVRVVGDIAALTHHHRAEIDWEAFEETVRSVGLHRRSWIALGLAADWFGANVPARLLEPPDGLRTAGYERALLARKQRRPFFRVPTTVLWAGSPGAAVVAAWKVGRAELRRRMPPGHRNAARRTG